MYYISSWMVEGFGWWIDARDYNFLLDVDLTRDINNSPLAVKVHQKLLEHSSGGFFAGAKSIFFLLFWLVFSPISPTYSFHLDGGKQAIYANYFHKGVRGIVAQSHVFKIGNSKR